MNGSVLARRATHGASLVEVLVAVLVFSLGLVGQAAVMIMATQANRAAFVRTHVEMLAGNMADRMRANPIGVWDGDYGSSSGTSYPSSDSEPSCDASSPCTPAQLAQRDRAQWSRLLQAFLPGIDSDATKITCTPATTLSSAQLLLRPPYNGTCTMSISWTEPSLVEGVTPSKQNFAWVFQP